VAGAGNQRVKKKKVAVRTAEEPGQTLNVDLCFVPVSHERANKLPAVSGSSGRLVVERSKEAEAEKQWPGRVFEQDQLEYRDAMLAFVNASRAQAREETKPKEENTTSDKAQKRALRQTEEQLRSQRRQVRQKRQAEDALWRTLRKEHKQQKEMKAHLDKAMRKTQTAHWHTLCQQRKQTLAHRRQEDAVWSQQRYAIRQRWSTFPLVSAWIAILVITDNCTRQCLGLPMFIAGARVTSEMVVTALQALLPPELLFLISDRGTHFTANAFRELVRTEEFIHVLIARHRPQSNGIAERFVRTLKEWLKDKSWVDDTDLALLLEQFLVEYNNRPHQGLPIPGLSPNEFAGRTWLM
jgi:transposase InsO family protein